MLEQATEKTARINDMEHISGYLLDAVRDRATARHIDAYEAGNEDLDSVHVGSPPSTLFFSGALAPRDEDLEPEEDDIYSRISPSAVHMFVRATPDGENPQLAIKPEFEMFYRIFPRWKDRDKDEDDGVYRKIDPNIDPITIDFPSTPADVTTIERTLAKAKEDIDAAINQAVTDTRTRIEQDPLLYSDCQAGQQLLEEFHADSFDDQEAYHKQAEEADGNLQLPQIEVEVKFDFLSKNDDGPVELKLSLENNSSDKADPDLIEHTVFDVHLNVVQGQDIEFAPFRFSRLPEDYRYDRELEGYGINCAVEQVDIDGSTALRTTCMPAHEQARYRHRQPTDESAVPTFESLSDDPGTVLRKIKSEMERYRDEVWATKVETLREQHGDSIAEEATDQMEKFAAEIERFEAGIQILSSRPELRRAFKLMNETFDQKVLSEDGSREYNSWRLFQIIYIVSNLPDLARREYPDVDADPEEVSLLWFPTGGGKTEAYLGLVVTAMHFDRIRDKEFGLTSMMRYPLRLLSLQQFQRITELFMYADEIRRQHSLGGERYSVGYLTGGTENKLRDLLEDEFNTSLDSRDTSENKELAGKLADRWNQDQLHSIDSDEYQFINSCPICDSSVVVRFNDTELTIDHQCTGESCDWDRLPVHVIDNEIYRHLPTMVVGTQDKLAALGYERKFRILLGHVAERCPEHGYTDGTECTEKYFCSIEHDDHISVYPKDPVPALQIQDELHLVKEELGTFESHYWSAMEKIIEWADYDQPKLIAATATIEASESQITHLYQRNSTLFPARGPEHRESFYATEDPDEIQRYFLGITPWNRSHINSVVSILQAHQRAVQTLDDDFDSIEELELDDFRTIDSRQELSELLRFYQTAVSYVISKKEGARVYTSVETQINEDLKRDGFEEISRMSLTGDSSFGAVSEMLDRFERLPDDTAAVSEIEELVIATSSISHGVDLDALNFMLFFGMPRRTAEYIQSSSRVGRKYPGIVVDCFHPIRERDRSHFHYFDKYHEYQDWLVEPVPVNRWAKFSVKRTLPGLFMSLILQKRYDDVYREFGSPYLTKNIAKAHSTGMITREKLVEDLCEIYGTDSRNSNVFREEIEARVRQYLSAIDNRNKRFVSDSLPGNHRPMFSLRDVDQSVRIATDKDNGRIVENLANKSGGED